MMKTNWALAAACALLLASCSPFDGKTRGFTAEEAALKTRIDGLVNLARSMGWPDASAPTEVSLGVEGALGLRLVRSAEGAQAESLVVWSQEARDRVVQETKAKGWGYQIAPVEHLRPWVDRASPLPPGAEGWNPSRLAEWLVWEWAAAKGGADTAEKRSRVSFVAYKFAEALLIRSEGSGSGDLARWRDSVRDRQTFQILAADLRDQVRGILAAQKDPTERAATLKRIEANWLNVYHQQYPNRFLTNGYQGFGASGTIDPLVLETLSDEDLGWEAWDAHRVWEDGAALWAAVQAHRP